ncbi:MAG: Wzz/FepE/Etk N-terminal domain-containing protein [Bacteroidetes bacterium]|nr:Wzz/FepE/Etk N-terminal domain-containing protein [Bacteroidota bacterium]MCL1968960.1 Wzz/FepE/Etk N-terminal domain-containing protein [Bacteroidota bacterium]
MNNEFNSFSLINYVWKWRKLFLIVCFIVGVLTIVITHRTIIRPRFTSTAIIYAPRTNSVSKILTNETNINERLDIKAYAIEEETEQMMEILNSREIKDVLIERYDLLNYYGIKTNRKAWKAKLYETLENLMNIKRTQYGAIAISVTDWDPERAASMANDIAAELDTLKNRIERERALGACKALEILIQEAEIECQKITDSLDVLAKKGVFYYDYQVERVIQQYAVALGQGNMAGVQRLQKELEKLEKWGNKANALRREQLNIGDQIGLIRAKLLDAQMDAHGIVPVKFVIQKAIATDKKSYPKKIIIGILAEVGAFILTLMILLFIDKIKQETVLVDHSENTTQKE